MTADAYTQWDAAYVLGALTVPQRAEFEEHLATCGSCRAAVTELAGIPGLLAQVPPGEALALEAATLPDAGDGPTPPRSLMPPLLPLPPVGTAQRRWGTPLVATAAACAALLVGGIGGYAASSASRSPRPAPPTVAVGVPGRLAFTAVQPSSMTAVVDVVPVAGGTELRVECQYATGPAGPGSYGRVDYAIWVVARDGRATALEEWTARPGELMRPSALTSLPVAGIGAVEIRRVDTGRTVMRADVA